jgi:hypothetical protein
MPEHPQVPVEVAGESFGVDEQLVPLIRALWARGFRTVASCQGQTGTALIDPEGGWCPPAWVAFVSVSQAERFAELSDGMLVEMTAEDREEALRKGEETYDDTPGIRAVAFPSSMIKAVTAALEALPVNADEVERRLRTLPIEDIEPL